MKPENGTHKNFISSYEYWLLTQHYLGRAQMRNTDEYLTEYYLPDTGDQFYPGCPSSISKGFQKHLGDSRLFFPQNSSAENRDEAKKEEF